MAKKEAELKEFRRMAYLDMKKAAERNKKQIYEQLGNPTDSAVEVQVSAPSRY
jgi:hypothetical protein